MKRLIVLDSIAWYDHSVVMNRAIGATFYQLYRLIFNLSKDFEIICFNKNKDNSELDGIKYFNWDYLDEFQITEKDTILILNKFPEEKIKNKIKDIKTIYWRHHQLSAKELNELVELKENSTIVVPSYSSKNQFLSILDKNKIENKFNISVIYNILYDDELKDFIYEKIDFNRLVYASAWHKGLNFILNFLKDVFDQNPNITLTLMNPGYDHDFEKQISDIKQKFSDRVVILGKQKKKDYASVIASSLCVLAPPFFETFGCVFAESLYLGTPVIYPSKSGAVKEVVGDEYVCEYDDPTYFINLINKIQQERIVKNFELSDKFKLDKNIISWKEIL